MVMSLFSEPEYEVPHPSVDITVLLVVEEAIRAAWQILREQPPANFDIKSALEETINHHLRETLQDRVWRREVVPGFDASMIACITSAEEVRNHDGKELKKRPDMIVKLVGVPENARPSQYGIFIECKPIGPDHKLTGCYCRKGIIRFITGRYAWAMQDAMMVGYVQGEHGQTELDVALNACSRIVLPTGSAAPCAESAKTEKVPTLVTKHRRRFKYLETNNPAPEILLRHVWLSRN